MDWVRKIQAEVGLKDAPDPRPEMVRRLKAYPKLVAAMKRCIAGMPHSAPQEEAISLMRELGEIAPHR